MDLASSLYFYYSETVEDDLSAMQAFREVRDRHFEPLTDQFQGLCELIVKMMSDPEASDS